MKILVIDAYVKLFVNEAKSIDSYGKMGILKGDLLLPILI
jgi:hypothetical protein